MSLYQINVEDTNNNVVSFDIYKEKVLLIVNTATSCFFTPQYKGLQFLYSKYKDKGFEVLDFPCNQFSKGAKGTNYEINEFCVKNYETEFPKYMDSVIEKVLKAHRTSFGKDVPTYEEELKEVTKDKFEYVKALVDVKKIMRNFLTLFLIQFNKL